MSGNCTGWVLREGPRPDDIDRDGRKYGSRARGYRAVLVTIADAANRDGEHAHPGQKAMIEGSLYGRSQVVAIVNELLAEGWVTVEEEGGGRGKATVYRVEMARRDTVQSLDGMTDANRPVSEEKPCDLEQETARSQRSDQQERARQRTTNVKNNNPATASAAEATPPEPERDEAREVVQSFWDWCAREGKPKPTLKANGKGNPFMALVHITRGLLDADWPRAEVKQALIDTPVYTVDAVTMTLNKNRERRGNGQPAAPRPVIAMEDATPWK